ncbi:MAG: TonB-dependent receptor [Bacteroidota bacterium]
MKTTLATLFILLTFSAFTQTAQVQGQLQDPDGEAVVFANVALYNTADSVLVKVETTDESGVFRLRNLAAGTYRLTATYVGAEDLERNDITLAAGQSLDLEVLQFASGAIELAEATVTAQRALVEVKPDRTVFNVEGTINSVGQDAIALLRMAPGVTVDNNNNINVLGRAGVLLFVDGKQLPLTGDDLVNYLQSLRAEQIDRIDIITNPGSKYDAEGNAGIIDIRLKRNDNYGVNGSLSGTTSRGQLWQSNGSASLNYRNKLINTFARVGGQVNDRFDNMDFLSTQNGIFLNERNRMTSTNEGMNYRLGTDFFLGERHTVGFLFNGNNNTGENAALNRTALSPQENQTAVDSVLISDNSGISARDNYTFNLNYRWAGEAGKSFNVDADYGTYRRENIRNQPNRYFDANEEVLLTEIINEFDTPTEIDIYTFRADYEADWKGGRFGAGAKMSKVVSDNTFLFFDRINGVVVRNDRNSNTFDYDETVYAGYFSYNRPINEKWSFSAGLRAEQTDAVGQLTAFVDSLREDPVVLDYLQWFPNAGLTWQVGPTHVLSFNYGRRINRPDYNVLNPFNNQLSELSYEKGNPFLSPEIVNNFEVGYTLKYMYNFKLGYSLTTDQITRLIGPDAVDPRANFITWENLAEQKIISFNASAPVQFSEKWNGYFNFSASYLDNQADYGDGVIVDVQAFTYSIYQQQTFKFPYGFQGEMSGWFSGPGVWGGVFEYETSWSLDIGLQKKFFQDALTVRLSGSDLFYESGWDGVSVFNGLESAGGGRWDSRRASLSLNYKFGNQKVKSRRRSTGLEDEAKRVGG